MMGSLFQRRDLQQRANYTLAKYPTDFSHCEIASEERHRPRNDGMKETTHSSRLFGSYSSLHFIYFIFTRPFEDDAGACSLLNFTRDFLGALDLTVL